MNDLLYVKNLIDMYYHLDSYEYNDELQTFSDGEIEYQLRTGFNDTVYSILVRFVNDKTHTYREFFVSEFSSIFKFLDAVFDDNVIEELNFESYRKIRVARENRKN